MSRDDLVAAQRMLDQWPEPPGPQPLQRVSDGCRRLLDAADGLAHNHAGWRDVAALVRQVLLTARETYGGNPSLVAPSGPEWPRVDQWATVECLATRLTDGRLRIRADDWEPPSAADDGDLAGEAARDQVRVTYRDIDPAQPHRISADPFWTQAHGYPTYRGETQRQAARAAVLNEEGSVVVALPTGRGKTAVAWSKVLLSNRGVTVVVVPTIVLAVDMERRTQELARDRGLQLSPLGRYAYIGPLERETKSQLRDAVRAGSQRLLYTSPEAFVSGLAPAVLACAEAGLLQQVVIDEAHLVDQWGTDFRPEFQTMPGLVRDAYGNAPIGAKPSVLLMTATLAQRPVTLLREFFSVGPRPAALVWGSELRREPAYFIASHDDEPTRQAAVLKAIDCLPRPLILYVTKVDDANDWAARLRASGLCRVGTVTGKSSDVERRSVMEQWRGAPGVKTGYDVVVGTSAFGLGLDMPNVRTVVHACLPETVDRYYQEVGRAGRDGRPSIAYMAVGPGDRHVAERLSAVTVIGDERGWNRWQGLLRSGRPLTDLRYRVRKSALPMHLDEGYGRSKQWNIRTLTLMAQAGIIRLRVPHWIPEPDLTEAELDASRSAFFEEVEDYIEFEFVNGELLSREGWTSALGRVRQEVHEAQRRALNSMLELARAQECVGRKIAAHYRVRDGRSVLVTQPACRGCPSCRRNPSSAPPAPPEPVPDLPEPRAAQDPLAKWRGSSPSLFVWYVDGEDIAPLLVRMAQRSVNVFSGLEPKAARRLQRASASSPIVLDEPGSVSPLMLTYRGPIGVVLREPRIPDELVERERLGLVSYIIAPGDTPSPDRPRWLRRDAGDAISASALMKEL